MSELDDLKQSFDLRSLAARLLNSKGKHHRAYDVYPCFKHRDTSPALTIYDNSFYCYECGIGGSVIDFLMEYEGISLVEAIKKAGGTEFKALPKVEHKPEPVRNIPMTTVEENAKHIKDGLPFFQSRHITDGTSYDVPLGVKLDYRSSYQTADGEWFSFNAKRYAVPNIFNGVCRAINYRRDDQSFLESFKRHPMADRILSDLRNQYGSDDEGMVLKHVSGAKYKQHVGSKWRPFNVSLIAHREEGRTVYGSFPFILLHSEPKEFDTLAVMDAGYPCMGILATNEVEQVLPKLFQNVPLLYIIRDNDEAGLTKAVRLQNILGRGRIISPIEGKDTGDTLQAGLFSRWMATLGLDPILR
jgi:hypothetical protein